MYATPKYKTIEYEFNPKNGSFTPKGKGYAPYKPPSPFKAAIRPALPVAVGVIGFGVGYAIGQGIYKVAEKPNNPIQGAFDFAQGTGNWGRNSPSSSGKKIQEAEYPFTGGQVIGRQYTIAYDYRYKRYNWSNPTNWSGFQGGIFSAPIRNIQAHKEYGSLGVLVTYGAGSSTQKITNVGIGDDPENYTFEIQNLRIIPLDGASEAQDQAQGGNPPPIKPEIGSPPRTAPANNSDTSPNRNTPESNQPQWADPIGGNSPNPFLFIPPVPAEWGQTEGQYQSEPFSRGQTNSKTGTETATKTNTNPTTVTTTKTKPTPQPQVSTATGTGTGTTTATGTGTTTDPTFPPIPIFPNPIPNSLDPTTTPNTPNTPNTSNTPSSNRPTTTDNIPKNNTDRNTPNYTGQPQTSGSQCCISPPSANQGNQIANIWDALQLLDLTLLKVINSKLGSQLNGGISGFLTNAWASTAMDRAINGLNLLISLHNAQMLSRNLADTLTQIIENGIAIIGIKDYQGNPIDISQIFSNGIENVLKTLLGEGNYTAMKLNWRIASTIYNSSINIYQNIEDGIRSLGDSLEIIAKYNSQVGNALKRSGVIDYDSYDWMSEDINISYGRTGKLNAIIKALENATEIAEDIEHLTGEIRNTVENVNQLQEEYNSFKTQIEALAQERENLENQAEIDSTSPNITKPDKIEGEDPEQ